MSKEEDLENQRLKELQVRIWAYQIRKTLQNKKSPEEIPSNKIESNRGRIGKALRLLDTDVTFLRNRDTYGIRQGIYKINNLDHSKTLAAVPTFISTWKEFHKDIFNYEDPRNVGYINLNNMKGTGVLHVYWNPDDYDTIEQTLNDGIKSVEVYPKALKEVRIKAILKAIIEEHFQNDFTRKIERYLNLPPNSFKDDDTLSVCVRNFSHYAATFSQEWFEGTKGFVEEYNHFRKYFEALIHGMTKFMEIIKTAGGYAEIVRRMRKDSIQTILVKCPLFINYNKDEDNNSRYQSEEKFLEEHTEHNKEICTFILRNAEYFDYDTIYGDDESLEDITCERFFKDNMKFEPETDELTTINKMELEKTQCTKQMISKILESTSETAVAN